MALTGLLSKGRRIRLAAITFAAVTALTACSSTGTTAPTTSSGSTSSATSAAPSSSSTCSPPSATATGKTIEYITAQTGVVYYDAVSSGFKKAASELGFTYKFAGRRQLVPLPRFRSSSRLSSTR